MKTGKARPVPLPVQTLDALRKARAGACGARGRSPACCPGAMLGDKVKA